MDSLNCPQIKDEKIMIDFDKISRDLEKRQREETADRMRRDQFRAEQKEREQKFRKDKLQRMLDRDNERSMRDNMERNFRQK